MTYSHQPAFAYVTEGLSFREYAAVQIACALASGSYRHDLSREHDLWAQESVELADCLIVWLNK
jgi:hypothetical protein